MYKPSVAIVIPCYNEEKRILPMWEKLDASIQNNQEYLFHIYLINDGSTDRTEHMLRDIAATYTGRQYTVAVVSYQENKGKGYALQQGIGQAQADYYLIMDADGATDMAEIHTFLEQRTQADISIGSRSTLLAQRTGYKKILGDMSHRLIAKTLSLPYKDTQCGFKLFSHKTVYLRSQLTRERRGYDFELLYLAHTAGYSIKEIPVKRYEIAGSKIGIQDYMRTAVDLFAVQQKHGTFGRFLAAFKKSRHVGFASIIACIVLVNTLVTAMNQEQPGYGSFYGSFYVQSYGSSYGQASSSHSHMSEGGNPSFSAASSASGGSNTTGADDDAFAGGGHDAIGGNSLVVTTTAHTPSSIAQPSIAQLGVQSGGPISMGVPVEGCFSHDHHFIDIGDKQEQDIVNRLVSLCIIHGHNNQGQHAMLSEPVTMGHIYKTFARIAGLTPNTISGLHWSAGYEIAGEAVPLREHISLRDPDALATKNEVLAAFANIIAYYHLPEDTIYAYQTALLSHSEQQPLLRTTFFHLLSSFLDTIGKY